MLYLAGLSSHLAQTIIDRSPLTVTRHQSVLEVLQLLKQKQPNDVKVSKHCLSCVLVTEGNQLIGVFTEKDAIELITQGENLTKLKMSDLINLDPIAVCVTVDSPNQISVDQEISALLSLFDKHQISYLPVIDDQGDINGMITKEKVLSYLVENLQQELFNTQLEKTKSLENCRNHCIPNLEIKLQQQIADLQIQVSADELLVDLGNRIYKSLNLSEILETTVTAVRQLLKCDRTLIYRFTNPLIGIIVAESLAADINLVSYLGRLINESNCENDWRQPYLQAKVRIINDIYEANFSSCHLQLLEELQIRAKLIVPILQNPPTGTDTQPILWGLLVVSTQTTRDWRASEIQVLQKLSTQLGIAIQQSELYEKARTELQERQQIEIRLQRQAQQQEALAQISQQALSNNDIDSLLQTATTLISKTMDVKYASLWELLPNQTTFWLRCGVGWRSGLIKQARVSTGDRSLPGYTLQQTEPVIVTDLLLETRFSASPIFYSHQIISSLTVIVPGHNIPFAILGAHANKSREFVPDEISFLQAIANVIAMGVKRQKAEDELNQFFDLSLDLLAIVDTHGYFQLLNPRFSKILGYSLTELQAKPFINFVHPDDQLVTQYYWRELLMGIPVFDYENRYLCKDGSYRWLAWTAIPSTTEDSIYTVARDMTDRKLVESALLESESRFRSVLENAPSYVILINISGNIQFVNRDFGGIKIEKLIGLNSRDLIVAEDRELHQQAIAQVYQSGETVSLELRGLNQSNQQLIYYDTRIAPIWQQETVQKAVMVMTDISDRKQAEAQIDFQASLLAQVRNGIMAVDLNSNIIYWNQYCEKLYQWTAQEAVGCSAIELIVPIEYSNATYQKIIHLEEHGFWEGEFTFRRKDGSTFIAYVIDTILHNRQGNKIGYLVIITDISELKAATDQIRQQVERERLLNQTAQKIRQSLNLVEILNTTVAEVRLLLECDRVLVYQLDAKFNGEIVAESVASPWSPTLGVKIQDTCFKLGGINKYLEGHSTAIADIYNGGLTKCHIELLQQFQVKANLVVPILLQETNHQYKLWGLLIVHQCASSRQWEPEQLDLLEELAVQLAIAIYQSQLYQDLQNELSQRLKAQAALQDANTKLEVRVAERTALLKDSNKKLQAEVWERKQAEDALQKQMLKSQLFAEITLKIRESLQLQEILQTTVTELQKILVCDRILIYRVNPDQTGCVIAEAVLPGWPSILNTCFPQEVFPAHSQKKYQIGKIQAISDVSQEYEKLTPCLLEFLAKWQVQAKLVVPILLNQQLWGLIIAHQCAYPRQWLELEVEILQQLANQVGVAISQAQLLEAQQQSESQFRLMAEHSTDMISRHTPNGIYLYASPASFTLLGYDPSELINHSVYDFLHPDDQEILQNLHFNIVHKVNINPETVVYRICCKDGRYIWFETTTQIIQEKNHNNIQEILAVSRNITARKIAEIALQDSQKFIQSVTDASPNILYIYDLESNQLIYINKEIYNILGYTLSDFKQIKFETIIKVIYPEDMQKLNQHQANLAILSDEAICEIEYRILHANGVWRWLASRETVFTRSPDGKPKQILGTAVDITDRKEAEEKLKKSLQEKELLLKEIHHRVKNNLLVVSSLLEFQADYTDDTEIKKLLADSQSRIYSMALIHEKLYRSTNLDKIDFGGYLENLVENLCESYYISDRHLEFDFNIAPIELNIETAHPCGLIVNELVSNIFKHAFPDGRGGKISIDFDQDSNGQITLTVKDNGVGLPENLDFRHTESLGMELICTLTAQLKGEINLDRSNGTAFTLKFTELKYQKRW